MCLAPKVLCTAATLGKLSVQNRLMSIQCNLKASSITFRVIDEATHQEELCIGMPNPGCRMQDNNQEVKKKRQGWRQIPIGQHSVRS